MIVLDPESGESFGDGEGPVYLTRPMTVANRIDFEGKACHARGPSPGVCTSGAGYYDGQLVKFSMADSWGAESSSPREAYAEIEDARETLEGVAGWALKDSAMSTLLNAVKPLLSVKYTPQRYAQAYVNAIHGGPIVHTQRNWALGEHGFRMRHHKSVMIDRRAAFLAELQKPLPVGGYSIAVNPGKLTAKLIKRPGISRGIIEIPEGSEMGFCPFLPCEGWGYHRQYRTGFVVGTWDNRLVSMALDNGAKIHWIQWVVNHKLGSELAGIAEDIEAIREVNKPLARSLYTRLWGSMSSVGGWAGYPERKPECSFKKKAGLYWRIEAPAKGQPITRPCFRPDIAAEITNGNAIEVFSVFDSLQGSYCHVDSIVTHREIDKAKEICSPKIGGWAIKWDEKTAIDVLAPGQYNVIDERTGKLIKAVRSGERNDGRKDYQYREIREIEDDERRESGREWIGPKGESRSIASDTCTVSGPRLSFSSVGAEEYLGRTMEALDPIDDSEAWDFKGFLKREPDP